MSLSLQCFPRCRSPLSLPILAAKKPNLVSRMCLNNTFMDTVLSREANKLFGPHAVSRCLGIIYKVWEGQFETGCVQPSKIIYTY